MRGATTPAIFNFLEKLDEHFAQFSVCGASSKLAPVVRGTTRCAESHPVPLYTEGIRNMKTILAQLALTVGAAVATAAAVSTTARNRLTRESRMANQRGDRWTVPIPVQAL
jgi:hypothetical protein